ncbi:MAG: hypothetical protein R2825_17265 [Saprospiraceae bacterium]
MSNVPFILLLRLRQVRRAIAQAGIGVVLLAALATFGMVMQMLAALREMDWPAVSLIVLALTWSLQAARKDLPFLRSICKNSWAFKSILSAEYLMLLSPLLLLYGWGGQWQQLLVVVGASLITALTAELIPITNKQQTKKSLPFIPQNNFEIKSRVEKNPILFSVIYGLSFLSFFHISFFPISIIIFSIFLADTFKYYEPTTMVHWKKDFVFEKLKRNIGFLLLAYLPPFFLCLLFQWNFKWLAVYTMAILLTVSILAICFKYANYSPLYPEMESSNTLSFLLLLSFLPGFILITISFSFVQYFKAIKNMEYFFGP